MIYDLPGGPPVTVVSPDDTSWWTTLGIDPTGRHALVLGDPSTPADATIVTGPIPALDIYLQQLASALDRAVPHHDGPTVTDRTILSSHRPTASAAPAPAPAGRSVLDLVRLPHTGISIAEPRLRVTSLRLGFGPDSVAYTAALRLGRRVAGVAVNDGFGGPTRYRPAPGSPLSPRLLSALVAASRDEHGNPIAETDFLDTLVTEYENVRHVRTAGRLGRSALRLQAPVGDGDLLAEVHYTQHRALAAAIGTPEQRDVLITVLRRRPVPQGAWWQLWTGDRWDDLTTPAPLPPREPAP